MVVYSKVYSNIIMVILLMIMVMGFASAEIVKFGDSINITQGCSGSTYSNISQIKLNGQLISSSQIAMIPTGGGSYTYPYTPLKTGEYYILTHCNEYGVDINAPFSFSVTPSGDADLSNTSLSFVLILIIFSVMFLVIGYSIDANKWLLKSALYIVSLLIMLINIALGLQLSQSANISSLMTTALIVGTVAFALFIMYMFVIYLVNVVRAFKNAKQEKKDNELL